MLHHDINHDAGVVVDLILREPQLLKDLAGRTSTEVKCEPQKLCWGGGRVALHLVVLTSFEVFTNESHKEKSSKSFVTKSEWTRVRHLDLSAFVVTVSTF